MNLTEIFTLRQDLHNCPECSGHKIQTRATLIDFLSTHTTLELHHCGDGFYAAHREPGGTRPPVALRADYDAIPLPGGGGPTSAATTAT